MASRIYRVKWPSQCLGPACPKAFFSTAASSPHSSTPISTGKSARLQQFGSGASRYAGAFSRTNHCDLPYDTLNERFALLASTQGTDSGCSTCLPREVRLFSLGNREESV